jgi:Fe-Mn family superoxide dismutase
MHNLSKEHHKKLIGWMDMYIYNQPQPYVPPGQHHLPPLPYPYNALEPVISSRTLQIHHDILHKGYVDNLNKTELALVAARQMNNFDNIRALERNLAYNGSGHILHSIYWTIMTPGCAAQTYGHTKFQIVNYFGSVAAFIKQFTEASRDVEASGWGVLCWIPSFSHLEILTAENHQKLTDWGCIPVLVCDVWEHAYYLDYENHRPDYIKAWWQLVNWDEVEQRLVMAMQVSVPLTLSYYS